MIQNSWQCKISAHNFSAVVTKALDLSGRPFGDPVMIRADP
jgi:hypothetical protein